MLRRMLFAAWLFSVVLTASAAERTVLLEGFTNYR